MPRPLFSTITPISAAYVRLNVANDAQVLGPGKYLIDSSGGVFSLRLAYAAGSEWEFKDIDESSVNNVSIGLATDTFNAGGAAGVQPGPFIIDIDHVVAEIVADPVTANLYHVHIHSGFLVVTPLLASSVTVLASSTSILASATGA